MKHLYSAESGSCIRETGPVTIYGNVGKGAQIEITAGSLVIAGNVGANVKINCTAESSHTTMSQTALNIMMGSDKSGSVTIRGSIAENVDIKYSGTFDCTERAHPTARITHVVSQSPSTYRFESNQNSFSHSRNHSSQPNRTFPGSSDTPYGYQDSSNLARVFCTTWGSNSTSDDRSMHAHGKYSHQPFKK